MCLCIPEHIETMRKFAVWIRNARTRRVRSQGMGSGGDEHSERGRGHHRKGSPPQILEQRRIHALAHDLAATGEKDDQKNQGWGQEAINYRGPKQHFHGFNACEIQSETQGHGDGHHRVEFPCACRLIRHGAAPRSAFRHGVSRRTHENRHPQHSGSNQAEREKEISAIAG